MSLSNSQASLAEEIRGLVAASDAAMRDSVEKALEAGRRLLAAKAECPHGTWLPFLERAGVHERQARRLMQIADSELESDTVSDLGGIKATLAFLSLVSRLQKIADTLETPKDSLAKFFRLMTSDAAGAMEDAEVLLRTFNKRALKRDLDRLLDMKPLLDELVSVYGGRQ